MEYQEKVNEYNRITQQLASVAKQPPQMRVVDTQAPRTGFTAAQLQARIVANVMARMPSPPPAVDNPMVARGMGYRRPTPSELDRFSRYVSTVNDPTVALTALERGRLTKDHVEALRDNYPKIYEQLRATAIKELAAAPVPDRSKAIQLGWLLDMPLDPTLDPTHIRISQSVYQGQPQGAATAPPPRRSDSDLEIPNTKQTNVQRIEAGEMETM
jgi:hypothetical protein